MCWCWLVSRPLSGDIVGFVLVLDKMGSQLASMLMMLSPHVLSSPELRPLSLPPAPPFFPPVFVYNRKELAHQGHTYITERNSRADLLPVYATSVIPPRRAVSYGVRPCRFLGAARRPMGQRGAGPWGP